MTKLFDVPCYNCICVPVCKYKRFHQLTVNCQLVTEYLCRSDNNTKISYYYWVQRVLRPVKWKIDHPGDTHIQV